MLDHEKCLVWWVAPIYKELIPATEKVRDLTHPDWILRKYETQNIIRYIQLKNESECYFHSADREDSLRGMGLDGLVIDEAAQLKKNRWSGELEPSLMDKDGWAIFIGTPRGPNWFHELFLRGQTSDRLYKSWRFSSYDNAIENGGFIKKSSIDVIANDMPEQLRRQEIYGVFLEGEGVVFRNIERQTIQEATWDGKQNIVVGCDLAKHQDFTVMVALASDGRLVGIDRFQQYDWHFQRQKIRAFCERLGEASLLIDSTGVGDPVYDELQREYRRVNGYKITQVSKKELIENLSMMFDNGEIWLTKNMPFYDVLKAELEAFAYELTPSGNITYSAPEGFHDDCVIALALAAWQLKREPRGEIELSFETVKK